MGNECLSFQAYFQSQVNHPLAGFKKIRHSPNSQKVIQLRSSIERHLKTKLNNVQCYVATHHWPIKLVTEQFITKKRFPSTTLSTDDARKYGIFDHCDIFKLKSNGNDSNTRNNKDTNQYVKAPISSKDTVKLLCKSCDSRLNIATRKRKRHGLIEDDKKHRKKKRVKESYIQFLKVRG